MIVGISGKVVAIKDQALVLDVQGIHYEILVPASVLQRVEQLTDKNGFLSLVTYHYYQITPSSGTPVLIGFANDIERDFFMQFITVSGIGPRAAIRALDRSIAEIAQAISEGNVKFLTQLPGIGNQRAKEIVAKLQDKMGKFMLIQDQATKPMARVTTAILDWQEEVLAVLTQLQYKKAEALEMIERALKRAPETNNAEALLNEIYKQRVTS